jgi:hypothetical protein
VYGVALLLLKETEASNREFFFAGMFIIETHNELKKSLEELKFYGNYMRVGTRQSKITGRCTLKIRLRQLSPNRP